MIGVGVFWAIPIILCMFIGRSKRRKWYWFAFFGILSWAGVAFAGYMSARKVERESADNSGLPPQDVRLTWGKPTVDSVPIGDISVEVRLPYDSDLSDVAHASEALRTKAAHTGANAVQSVEYFTQKASWLTFNPERITRARGQVMRVWLSELSKVPNDAEALGEYMHMDDPERVLASALRYRALLGIFWAAVNSAMAYGHSIHLGPSERLIIPPAAIYAVSACMLVVGILCLFGRYAGLLILDGLVVIVLGVLNLIGGTYHLGIAQVFSGLESGLVAYPRVVNLFLEEYTKRAAFEPEEDEEEDEDDVPDDTT